MAYDEKLAGRVREEVAGVRRLSERHMFGGIAFLVGGNMACGVQGDGLIVRVGPDLHHDALTRPHVREMDFTGRPMKGFVSVTRDGVADDAELALWVRLGLAYAGALPVKKAPPKKKKQPKAQAKQR